MRSHRSLWGIATGRRRRDALGDGPERQGGPQKGPGGRRRVGLMLVEGRESSAQTLVVCE